MRTKKELVFIFAMLALMVLAVSFSAAQPADSLVTSNVSSPSVVPASPVTVKLAADKYVQGSQLQGSVKFYFDKPIGTSTKIDVKMFGRVYQYGIEQLLQNASKNYTLLAGILNGTDPSPVKVLYFPGTGSQKIGVVLYGYSKVTSLSMNVSGPPGNQVAIPRMDVGDDGDMDWYYLGDLLGFNEAPAKPENLNDAVPGNTVLLNDNISIFCQKIDLPFGRHFKVEVNYKKTGSQGDLWAMILSPYTAGDFSYVTGEADRCDLPEDVSAGYKECVQPISLPYAAKGSNLVCVVNRGSYDPVTPTTEYEIKSNSAVPSTTAYRCQKGIVDDFACMPVTQNNFYIRVKGGRYSYYLDRMSDFELFSLSPEAVLIGFRKFLGYDLDDNNPLRNFKGICHLPKCLVPLTVHVNGSGYITFENLKVFYISSEEVPSLETNFYSVMENPPMISRIGAADLSAKPYELEIPLSAFNLSAPLLPLKTLESANMRIDVAVDGNYSEGGSADFTVYSANIPDDQSKVMIAEAKDSLSSLSSSADENIILLLELSGMKAAIASGQQALAGMESEYAASGDSPELQEKISSARMGLPRSVSLSNGASEIQAISPDDITSEIVSPDKAEETYQFQSKVSVKSTVRSYVIEDFSGVKLTKSIIVKEITANDQLSRVNVFEVIPKSVAGSFNDIKFEETATAVKSDPIAKWFLGTLGRNAKKNYKYLVDGDVVSADLPKTILVPSEPEADKVVEPTAECGNAVCEEGEDEAACPDDCKEGMPFTTIAIMAVGVLVLILVAMKFLRKSRKSPFAKPEDLKAMVGFVKKMRTSGKKDDDISKLLIGKGWKQEHVKFAMEEISMESKKGVSSGDPKLQPLRDYIKVALSKGKKQDEIKKTLLSQGWDAKVIEQELARK